MEYFDLSIDRNALINELHHLVPVIFEFPLFSKFRIMLFFAPPSLMPSRRMEEKRWKNS